MQNFIFSPKIVVTACLIFLISITFAQVKNKDVHLSVVPGLSSTGLDPGNISAALSLNLFSGYLHSLHGIEISGISSLAVVQTRGIQFSGLFNTTGTNSFAEKDSQEVRQMQKNGYSADLIGLQVSGLINSVRGNATGAQITLGANSSRSLIGVQIAGLVNQTDRYLLGGQLALLSNISKGSSSGFQVTLLLNSTKDDLEGAQLGLINIASTIDGKNSVLTDKPTAWQIGGFNKSKKMNGYQVGLINLSGEMRGTQIGLINIYSTPYRTSQKSGTSIGLLNVGNSVNLKYFFDETFDMNYALATGNSKNAAIMSRSKTNYNMSYLLYRTSNLKSSLYRAYGYGFEHSKYKYTIGPMNEFNYLSAGVNISYVDFEKKTSGKDWLFELSVEAGTKLHQKLGSLYLLAAIDGNMHKGSSGNVLAPSKLSSIDKQDTDVLGFWPGFRAGIMIR